MAKVNSNGHANGSSGKTNGNKSDGLASSNLVDIQSGLISREIFVDDDIYYDLLDPADIDMICKPDETAMFMVPWALEPENSHLLKPDDLRRTVEAAGFEIVDFIDQTEAMLESYQRAREKSSRYFGIWVLDYIDGEGRHPTQIAASANADFQHLASRHGH